MADSIASPTEDWAMTADKAAQRPEYRWNNKAAASELRLRNAVEDFLRQRFPDARLCHEMVMGEGKVRADVVAIDRNHMVAVEVKGEYDTTIRLLHQVGMYQLSMPEVWIITAAGPHNRDAELIRYLLPSVGVIQATGIFDRWGGRKLIDAERDPATLTVVHEPVPRQPHPLMMMKMMWAQELANIVNRLRIMTVKSAKPPRAKMIAALLESFTPQQLMTECCTELRARQALWRADSPESAHD